MTPTATYHILTFDGGGIRGALSAALLTEISRRCPQLLPMTDLFAGTSAGSFIALGLANGLAPAEVAGLFSAENSRFVFTPRRIPLLRPRYTNTHLAALLTSAFGPNLRLGDLARRALALSFRLKGPEGGPWQPVFFHNYPNSDHLQKLVVHAALASSAAPIYFPSVRRHIDGGVVANNPSTAAISLAADPNAGGKSLPDIAVLSIGTGDTPANIEANTAGWGALQWALWPRPPLPLVSILFDGVSEIDTLYSSLMLGDRFFRLNPVLPEVIGLDDYRKIPDLLALAQTVDLEPVLTWLAAHWVPLAPTNGAHGGAENYN